MFALLFGQIQRLASRHDSGLENKETVPHQLRVTVSDELDVEREASFRHYF
jgi:hypothetical protein